MINNSLILYKYRTTIVKNTINKKINYKFFIILDILKKITTKFVFTILMFTLCNIFKLNYLSTFFFVSISGGFLNNSFSKYIDDTYISCNLLRINNKYIYYWYCFDLLLLLVFYSLALLFKFNILTAISISLLSISFKNIINLLHLKYNDKGEYLEYILGLISLVPVFLNINISENIYYYIMLIIILCGLVSLIIISKKEEYLVYKKDKINNYNIIKNVKNNYLGLKGLFHVFYLRNKKRINRYSNSVIVVSLIVTLIIKLSNLDVSIFDDVTYIYLIAYLSNPGTNFFDVIYKSIDLSLVNYNFYVSKNNIILMLKYRACLLTKVVFKESVFMIPLLYLLFNNMVYILIYLILLFQLCFNQVFCYYIFFKSRKIEFKGFAYYAYNLLFFLLSFRFINSVYNEIIFTLIYIIIGIFIVCKYSYKTFRTR